ncbi:AbrB family transcriptional regulator [Cryobacterium sp. N19]|uniref:AbrB family transcriptional regulator n=1 Tax=Cryobacterium sp. N19 TaxID=2048288 RepID=UPI001E3F45C1|nr:AbrB family transcriptional regulator [Cryobacterium sp. N19]
MLHLIVLLASGGLGAIGGYLLRLPMWPITGALVGSAVANIALQSSTGMPSQLSFVAQVLVGTAVGSTVLPGFMRQVRRMLVPVLVVVLSLVGAGLSFAVILSALGFLDAPEAFLGLIPGGVGEMVSAASGVGADSALIAGIHVVRLLISLWTLPLLIRWASRWRRRQSGDPGPAGGPVV